MSLFKSLSFAFGLMLLGSGASAATCNTASDVFSMTNTSGAVCIDGTGINGYFGSAPTVFGYSGWVMGDATKGNGGDGMVTFAPPPANKSTSGTFDVMNPGKYVAAVALKTGAGFALFLVDDLSAQPAASYAWATGNKLKKASIWYIPVPLPAGSVLLLSALALFPALRRRRRA